MLDCHSDDKSYDILKAMLSTGIEHDKQVSEIIRAAWSKLLAVTLIGQANKERIKSRPSNSKQKTCITLADIIAASQQLAAGALSLDQPETRLAIADWANEQPTIAQAADPSTDNEEVGSSASQTDSYSGLLVKRIVQLAKNKDNLMRVKTAYPDWFRPDAAVPALQTNPLVPFRYAPKPATLFQFNVEQVFNRYLVDNPEVFAIVEEEFNIYPYYVKDTSEGENTGFAYFDINMDEFVKSGRGLNMVQESVSVDDKTEDNCTLLVLGFQHVIHEWWGWVTVWGKATSGHTTNAKNIYMLEDRQSFG
ncbi:MAG: hypothetical protein M1840_002565 [Geoglossum simile]|nr:MAG: hypothetical protein M1840_002565 [Geoglossum simile]